MTDQPRMTFGPITRTDLVRYAGASGDFNPIHHDEEFARSTGLPSVMAHGMFSAGLLASFATAWFGQGAVRRFAVRFHEPVWPGDILVPTGEIITADPVPQDGLVDLALSLTRRDGTVVATARISVTIPPDKRSFTPDQSARHSGQEHGLQ